MGSWGEGWGVEGAEGVWGYGWGWGGFGGSAGQGWDGVLGGLWKDLGEHRKAEGVCRGALQGRGALRGLGVLGGLQRVEGILQDRAGGPGDRRGGVGGLMGLEGFIGSAELGGAQRGDGGPGGLLRAGGHPVRLRGVLRLWGP